jgi:hypothetical protein
MGTEIEVLAVEDCFLEKAEQDSSLQRRYEGDFTLD